MEYSRNIKETEYFETINDNDIGDEMRLKSIIGLN